MLRHAETKSIPACFMPEDAGFPQNAIGCVWDAVLPRTQMRTQLSDVPVPRIMPSGWKRAVEKPPPSGSDTCGRKKVRSAGEQVGKHAASVSAREGRSVLAV